MNSIVYGYGAITAHNNCVVIGDKCTTTHDGEIVIGDKLFGDAIPEELKADLRAFAAKPAALKFFISSMARLR